METSSFFIDKKALFGSFPSQATVEILEEKGVRFFVNLTCDNETKIIPYCTKYNYIAFPIPDGGIPTDRFNFTIFIYKICDIIKKLADGDMIYIHCKGGHGRSGVVVACISCKLFDLTTKQSIDYTTSCHSNRKVMRDKWRRIGSPQTRSQKQFVYNMCRSIIISEQHMLHPNYELDVTHPIAGTFKTASDAINHLAEKNDINMTIEFVTSLKIQQHPFLKKVLLDTCLRYLKFHQCPDSPYMKNLTHLRFDFYSEMF